MVRLVGILPLIGVIALSWSNAEMALGAVMGFIAGFTFVFLFIR